MDEVLLKYIYQAALESEGQAYLDAEEQLVQAGTAAVPFLQERLRGSSGLPRLITHVILERIAGNQDFIASLKYFDEVEQFAATTPMMTPPPESVAEYLIRHFGDNVSALMGVYLVKLDQVWPQWKTLGAILYLGRLNSAAAADPLIAFISKTPDDDYRENAVRALVSVGDTNLLARLEEEIKPFERARVALTQALEQIRVTLASKP